MNKIVVVILLSFFFNVQPVAQTSSQSIVTSELESSSFFPTDDVKMVPFGYRDTFQFLFAYILDSLNNIISVSEPVSCMSSDTQVVMAQPAGPPLNRFQVIRKAPFGTAKVVIKYSGHFDTIDVILTGEHVDSVIISHSDSVQERLSDSLIFYKKDALSFNLYGWYHNVGSMKWSSGITKWLIINNNDTLLNMYLDHLSLSDLNAGLYQIECIYSILKKIIQLVINDEETKCRRIQIVSNPIFNSNASECYLLNGKSIKNLNHSGNVSVFQHGKISLNLHKKDKSDLSKPQY